MMCSVLHSNLKMGVSQRWLKLVCRKLKLLGSSQRQREIVIPRTSHSNQSETEKALLSIETITYEQVLCKEDAAAIKIQACFRGHLVCKAIQNQRIFDDTYI